MIRFVDLRDLFVVVLVKPIKYKKRRYPNHFISKLSDADMENGETQVWLDVALACNYISDEKFNYLDAQCEEISKLLNFMISNPAKFA